MHARHGADSNPDFFSRLLHLMPLSFFEGPPHPAADPSGFSAWHALMIHCRCLMQSGH